MVTFCLAVIILLLAYEAGLIIGAKHERTEPKEEVKKEEFKMIVAKSELDGYRSVDVICSHHPKTLVAKTRLEIDNRGFLNSNTMFEVASNGRIVIQSPYIETALKRYNEL